MPPATIEGQDSGTEKRIEAQEQLRAAVDEITAAAASRGAFYRIMASLYFKELSDEQIANLKTLENLDLAEYDSLFAEGLNDMMRSVRKADSATRDDLACDYARAILGAGTFQQRRATPFESVFTSQTGLLMQEARDDVYRLFLQEHLEADASLRIPEDHLSFICEFMAILCDRFSMALGIAEYTEARRLLGVQQELLSSHLLNWIDDYCDVLKHVAKTRFYRGVSKITRSFVYQDEQFLADIIAGTEEIIRLSDAV